MTKRLITHVAGKKAQYPIFIKPGLLRNGDLATLCRQIGGRVCLITHQNLIDTLGTEVIDGLQSRGMEPELLSFPPGEVHKTRHTKEKLEDQLLQRRYGRDTLLLALGGGIVTDVTGFLAATFSRGVPWIALPTTLLGMVDASLGGKTGVNTPMGKNLIGAIHHPAAILMETTFLKRLPVKEIRNGFSEMIKHGLIADASVFEYLREEERPLLGLQSPDIEKAIADSCAIKQAIIQQDETEEGMRRLLNFGHTLGHAIEVTSQFAVSHGEAVALGMLGESHISMGMGYLPPQHFERIHHLIARYHPDLEMPANVDVEALQERMTFDKKALKGVPRFVVLEAIGKPVPFEGRYCTEVESRVVKASVEWLSHALYRR